MIMWFMLLRNAFKLFVMRWRYIYWYGAKGEVLTDAVMNQLIAAYPEFYGKYTPEQMTAYKNQARGKLGLDCSGFITLISGIFGASFQIWDKCVNKTDVVHCTAGSFLYKKGHCGLDIGYGYCMHIGIMGETITISKIQDVGFTDAGQLPNYNYEGALNV